MRSLLPRRWRAGPGRLANALIVDASEETRIAIIRRRRQRERWLGSWPADSTMIKRLHSGRPKRLVLRLAAEAVLEREVRLPAAADWQVAKFLGSEMDRLTPFQTNAIYWEGRIVERSGTDGRLTVRLAIVLKSKLKPLLDDLAKRGLCPSVAEVGTKWQISLDCSLAEKERYRRRLLARSGGIAMALIVIAVALAFARQSMLLAAWDARIAALRPRADEAAMLRARIATDTAGGATIAAESTRLGNPLQAIAALTEALPDSSFLTTLRVRRGALDFAGESRDAAKLIGVLAADRRFLNPEFAGSVNRSSNDGRDLFSIRTELRRLP